MKIQLDFTNKIITIESNINLFDFVKKIKVILPDWKDWTLNNNNSVIYWTNPIEYAPYKPFDPISWPIITYQTNDNNQTHDNNIYCLDVSDN